MQSLQRLSEQIVHVESAPQLECCWSGMHRSTSRWWCKSHGAGGAHEDNGGSMVALNQERLPLPLDEAPFSTHITCKIWLASKAVPGNRITGLDTCPDSTHTIFGYSSSPKSDSSFACCIHGFHTTITTSKSISMYNNIILYYYSHNILYLYLGSCISEYAFSDPIQRSW